MKIVFMGTPEFAVPCLRALAESSHEVAAVFTQPDKPKGRGYKMIPTPVKAAAEEYGLPVYQPLSLRKGDDAAESMEILKNIAPDLIVVTAYGQILPKEILELPEHGCINIHASLLPKYRGAAPIQYAVIDGLEETGVTTMFMDEGLDTGDILLQRSIPLAPDETGGSLFDKLSVLGAELLIETLDGLEAGTLQRTPQMGESTYVGMLKKSMGEIVWSRSAAEIERLIRGCSPWPSAYTHRGGRLLKIWRAEVLPGTGSCGEPGTVSEVLPDSFSVFTGEGVLRVLEVQPEGKKRMDAGAYLRGYPLAPGDRLD